MLKIINTMSTLHFSELMDVYAESNALNGAEQYPNLCCSLQIVEAEQNFYRYLTDVFFQQTDSFYAVWVAEERYVAALRIEPYKDGFLLCGLETAPDVRRHGYASILIDSVCDHLWKSGKCKLYSHVLKTNTPSLRTHQKCGFTIVLNYAVYSDGSVLHNHYTLLYEGRAKH